jgi:DNA adenine methylase
MMKAPFPYFGGKARIAAQVWSALGDCGHYMEPFCGSCAVLLARPHYDPQQHSETVNDADGMIANVWRALQADPDAVAKWCDWPVNHADLIARKKRLNLDYHSLLEKLCADEDYYDTKLAGYYIWAASCWIGHGLVCPGQIPHLADAGTGVHAKGQIPHLSHAGTGVHAKGQIPHLSDAGTGVHAKGPRPHLGHAGRGVRDPYNTPIYDWFRQLSERLRNVRVVCGDWSRVCGGNWQDGNWPSVGMFFDPPYSDQAERDPGIYAVDCQQVAHDVRQWCLKRGDRETYRIVLAGYYAEHAELLDHGWTVHRWSTAGGYGNLARNGTVTQGQQNRHKEALFFSPHCVHAKHNAGQMGLFAEAGR